VTNTLRLTASSITLRNGACPFTGDGRISLWCPAPPGAQDELVEAEPERFFKPATSARGVFANWLGVHLDTSGNNSVDWSEIAAIMKDAYRTIAPKQLVAELDGKSK